MKFGHKVIFYTVVIQNLSYTVMSAYDPNFSFDKINEHKTCKKDIGSDEFEFSEHAYPKNKQHLFDMCEEHAANTCCAMRDIDRIIARLNFIKRQEHFSWSEQCLQETRDMLCTNCDGDIGTGRRYGVCADLC